MTDMTKRVKKGGVYGFHFTDGRRIEGTAMAHGLPGDPIHLQVKGIEGAVYVNPDLVAFMEVVDESAAEQRNFDY